MLRAVALSIRICVGVDHTAKRGVLRNRARRCDHARSREQRESQDRGTGDWLQSDILRCGYHSAAKQSEMLGSGIFPDRSAAWRHQRLAQRFFMLDTGVSIPGVLV